MDLIDFRSQLERELNWRTEEILFYNNIISNFSKEDDKIRYIKSLILVLYAHYEGFTKMALKIYIQYINELNIKVKQVIPVLQAASLNKEFNAYDNLDRKNKVFKKKLPEDKVLHKISRKVEFLETLDCIYEKIVFIDDNLINTESNLKYEILQKNLYVLGINFESLESYKDFIYKLLGKRNNIAHGENENGIEYNDYQKWQKNSLDLMEQILILIYTAASSKEYLKK